MLTLFTNSCFWYLISDLSHRIIPEPKNGACQHGVPGLNQIREALLIIHYDILYVILLFIISRVCIINLSFR